MRPQRTIFVTGGTGNQGGAVARSLLGDGIGVRILTRNPASPRAQQLKALGAELVPGDLDRPETFQRFLDNVDGVFSVQTFANGIDRELQEGIALADRAKESGINHFVYSSVAGADFHTGVPQWESKLAIENHIKRIALPYTIIRPVSFYENFLLPQVRQRLMKGKLVSPVHGERVQQFMAAADVGRITSVILRNPEKYTGKTIAVAAEQMTLIHVARLFSSVFKKDVQYRHLPDLVTRVVMGKDLSAMFKWINEHDAVFVEKPGSHDKDFPPLVRLEDWIRQTV